MNKKDKNALKLVKSAFLLYNVVSMIVHRFIMISKKELRGERIDECR